MIPNIRQFLLYWDFYYSSFKLNFLKKQSSFLLMLTVQLFVKKISSLILASLGCILLCISDSASQLIIAYSDPVVLLLWLSLGIHSFSLPDFSKHKYYTWFPKVTNNDWFTVSSKSWRSSNWESDKTTFWSKMSKKINDNRRFWRLLHATPILPSRSPQLILFLQ